MNQADVAALMKGVAPVIRDLVANAVKPLAERIVELEATIERMKSVEMLVHLSPFIVEAVALKVAEIPPAPSGKDGIDGKDGADGQDGKSITLDDVRPLLAEMVDIAVKSLPVPKDGRSVSVEDVAPLIEERVSLAVSEAARAIPVPKDGKDGTDGAPGRDGIDGKDGAPGKLSVAKAWMAGSVTYEAELRTHEGATWQALRDTGSAPGGSDWICIAARGDDGKSADEIEVRGTWDAASTYRRLNIVALNGAAFMARRDDPGACPGEGWQVIAMRGKPGEKGAQGQRGERGEQGPAGPAVLHIEADGNGLVTLVNGDGSTASCDLYPLLSKIAG